MVFPGIAVSGGVITTNRSPVNFGLELTACFYSFERILNNETINQTAITGELNLEARMPLPNPSMSLGFRLGAGLFMLPGSEETDPLPGAKYFNMGLSFHWQIWKNLFLEAGLDHAHLFTDNKSGAFKPRLGAGWQF